MTPYSLLSTLRSSEINSDNPAGSLIGAVFDSCESSYSFSIVPRYCCSHTRYLLGSRWVDRQEHRLGEPTTTRTRYGNSSSCARGFCDGTLKRHTALRIQRLRCLCDCVPDGKSWIKTARYAAAGAIATSCSKDSLLAKFTHQRSDLEMIRCKPPLSVSNARRSHTKCDPDPVS